MKTLWNLSKYSLINFLIKRNRRMIKIIYSITRQKNSSINNKSLCHSMKMNTYWSTHVLKAKKKKIWDLHKINCQANQLLTSLLKIMVNINFSKKIKRKSKSKQTNKNRKMKTKLKVANKQIITKYDITIILKLIAVK